MPTPSAIPQPTTTSTPTIPFQPQLLSVQTASLPLSKRAPVGPSLYHQPTGTPTTPPFASPTTYPSTPVYAAPAPVQTPTPTPTAPQTPAAFVPQQPAQSTATATSLL